MSSERQSHEADVLIYTHQQSFTDICGLNAEVSKSALEGHSPVEFSSNYLQLTCLDVSAGPPGIEFKTEIESLPIKNKKCNKAEKCSFIFSKFE